jgi:hypothetical protein
MTLNTKASAEAGELTFDEPAELFLQNVMHIDVRI